MSIHVGSLLNEVRNRRPLVHNITNLVVTNIVANGLLSLGASPVMAYAQEEVADMAKIAQALALNMGTLTKDVVEAMKIAGRAANEAQVPIVFDPVGVGATPYRNEVAADLALSLHPTVIRGNAGELSVLLGLGGEVKGVDSVSSDASLPAKMKEYAKRHQVVLVATGETDYVTDGTSIWHLSNGHEMLSNITGSGCMLTGIIGAFIGAVEKGSSLETYAYACVAAITALNIAGETAAQTAKGPGTFHAQLFDALYHLTSDQLADNAKIEQV